MRDTHNNLTLTPMQAAGAIRYASTYNGSGQYTSEQLAIAKDMAYEALEKQIPQKPEESYDGYADGDPVIDYHCPNCYREVDEDDMEHHCECGKALDWSDAE
ncbi:MAG: hypothetical protein IJO73_02440 [Clostridia bacterium]|nr:hypothetical protein [Clostridia bacterium]